MQTIQFAPTADACQIEVPEFKPQAKAKKGEKQPDPVKVERSKPGSLHVRPGTTRAVTDDELEILKANKVKFHVTANSALTAKSEGKAKAAADSGDQAAPEAPVAPPSDDGDQAAPEAPVAPPSDDGDQDSNATDEPADAPTGGRGGRGRGRGGK